MSRAENIARVCHEANRALQQVQADPAIAVSPAWDNLDAETRQSAIDGVEYLLKTGASPAESHANWARFKLLRGWRWGPTKDDEAMLHPNLIAYDELPESQRVKDDLFGAIVGALR